MSSSSCGRKQILLFLRQKKCALKNQKRIYRLPRLFVGATLTVILRIPITESVVLSACVAVFYTLIGGLYAVAYTDVIQLCSIMAGLVRPCFQAILLYFHSLPSSLWKYTFSCDTFMKCPTIHNFWNSCQAPSVLLSLSFVYIKSTYILESNATLTRNGSIGSDKKIRVCTTSFLSSLSLFFSTGKA